MCKNSKMCNGKIVVKSQVCHELYCLTYVFLFYLFVICNYSCRTVASNGIYDLTLDRRQVFWSHPLRTAILFRYFSWNSQLC